MSRRACAGEARQAQAEFVALQSCRCRGMVTYAATTPMALFESLLALLLVSILLLKLSGHIGAPYPTMLAFAGACVAALPWVPEIEMEPRLALALFIAPALLDAAYDLPPRELRRDWLPLTWLALIAVVLTTAAVAWIGWAWAGMPLAAAIALGAIVAPPDAAAAAAVLTKFPTSPPDDGHPAGREPAQRRDCAAHLYRRGRHRHMAGNVGRRDDSRPARRRARRHRPRSRLRQAVLPVEAMAWADAHRPRLGVRRHVRHVGRRGARARVSHPRGGGVRDDRRALRAREADSARPRAFVRDLGDHGLRPQRARVPADGTSGADDPFAARQLELCRRPSGSRCRCWLSSSSSGSRG